VTNWHLEHHGKHHQNQEEWKTDTNILMLARYSVILCERFTIILVCPTSKFTVICIFFTPSTAFRFFFLNGRLRVCAFNANHKEIIQQALITNDARGIGLKMTRFALGFSVVEILVMVMNAQEKKVQLVNK
jgi:hypothetical protein